MPRNCNSRDSAVRAAMRKGIRGEKKEWKIKFKNGVTRNDEWNDYGIKKEKFNMRVGLGM